MRCRTASIVQPNGCPAITPERGWKGRRTMAKCKSARRSLGDESRIPVPVQIRFWFQFQLQSRAPMDRDRFRSAPSGARLGRDLYRAECLLQSRRSGRGGRDRTGRAAAPGLVSTGSSEHPFSPLAQCPRHSLRDGIAIRRSPPDNAPNARLGRIRRRSLLRYQRIANPERPATTFTNISICGKSPVETGLAPS
jgi:hypothetical protein